MLSCGSLRWICHNLFIHSTTDVYLGCVLFGAVMKDATGNILVQILEGCMFSFLLDKYI